jgi:hypothetical protein
VADVPTDELVYRDRALLVGETLVLADLHLGKGAASSVEFPLGASEDVVERVGALLDHFDPEAVVLAGDILHAFDYVPDAASDAFAALVDAVREDCARLVVLEGNHDAMLDSLWDGDLHDSYRIDGDTETVVCHGHERPDADADRYVMGHDHPAIVIEGQKRHCYLVGSAVYRGADLVVCPAFNRLVEGVTVNGRIGEAGERSPLLRDIGRMRPVVYDGEAGESLEFPSLDRFERML